MKRPNDRSGAVGELARSSNLRLDCFLKRLLGSQSLPRKLPLEAFRLRQEIDVVESAEHHDHIIDVAGQCGERAVTHIEADRRRKSVETKDEHSPIVGMPHIVPGNAELDALTEDLFDLSKGVQLPLVAEETLQGRSHDPLSRR